MAIRKAMLTSCCLHTQASISTCSKARSLTYRWFESSKTITTTSKDPRYFTVAGETHHEVMLVIPPVISTVA